MIKHRFYFCIIYTYAGLTLAKKVTILQVTTAPATAENVLFPSHNQLLTTSTDDIQSGGLWLSCPV